jgi:hypothetical protein
MKHGERMLLCTLAGLALCTSGKAVDGDSSGNPYQGIVDRNVFGLKPPPPPPDPESTKPPPPKVFLTGITTILGNKRALLKMTPPAKPGEPAKEQSFTLGEGQREGDIEVLAIDEKAGTVKVNNYGTIATLDFENNGVKVVGGPPPAAIGAGGRPPGFVPAGGVPAMPPPGGAGNLPRPMRLPTPGGAAVSPASAQAAPVNGSGVALPAFGTGTPSFSQPQQEAAAQLTREQQAIILAAQKQRYQSSGSPIASLIPPLPGEMGGTAATESSSGTPAPKPWTPPRAPSLPPLPR